MSKDSDLGLVIGGAFILWLLMRNSQGTAQTQAAINTINTQAANQLNNAAIISGTAQNVNQDIAAIADAWSY